MKGIRKNNGTSPHLLAPGEYCLFEDQWYGCAPNGLLAGLAKHRVTEHEDETVTVSPSILVDNRSESWHGYLVRGVWVPCP